MHRFPWGLKPARQLLRAVLFAALLGTPVLSASEPVDPAAILQDLRTFGVMGTVLHVGAHPDDENTQLITYLARGRGYRAAYLSVTRGDGGQNLLGPDFDEKLGVARTQELLAARRLDGGRQFFTRAIDFGFSKTPEETLRIWDRQAVLADVVRVIRMFRPDVIATRFSPQGGGHGHHTASAILAAEAFKLAGDANAFPEQLADGRLTVWRPKRVLVNGRGGGTLQIDVSGKDPVLGESFASISSRSRAMHKTQGFGLNPGRGGGGDGPRMESFQLLDGEPATTDIMDGIDTTWARVPGGAEIARLTAAAIAQFNPQDPAASVPALLALHARAAALPGDPIVAEKRRDLDRLIAACLGLEVTTTVARAEIVAGEAMAMQHTVQLRGAMPVRWTAVRYPAGQGETRVTVDLRAGQPATREATQTLPASTPLSQPYWLRAETATGAGIVRVDDASLIGLPENPPVFPVEHVFEIIGRTVVLADEPVRLMTNAAGASVRRRLDVIPPVNVAFAGRPEIFAPGQAKTVSVALTAARAGTTGSLRLDAPAGWKVAPASHAFKLAAAGEQTHATFTITAPAGAGTATIDAVADVGGTLCRTGRFEINYAHIPLQLLQPVALLKTVSLDLAIRGGKVAYLPGAGDDIARALAQMGFAVTELAAPITAEKLREFGSVVVGVRAYNTREDLATTLPALFAYAEGGGTVVVQYNRPNNLRTEVFAPYRLQLSNDRVTDENAEMTFLVPDHPVLHTPNRITAADFAGWVQERGVYFPNQWAEQFTPILACADAGEAAQNGSLLIARHGQGYFVYTGLAFFRQIPEGVPGAYRLFANLVSLGK